MGAIDELYPDLISAWNALRKVWVTESKQWTVGRLRGDQILEGQDPVVERPLEANKDYFTVSLRSLWIRNSRVGWTTFYPAMHAFATVPVYIGHPSEFHVLTSPTELKAITEGGLGRVIAGRQRLVGPLAYWGNEVSLELALFSIKEQDLAAPFLGILSELSSVAGGAFLTSALAVAEPLKKGIATLTGTNSNVLEIGYFADLDRPATGYYTAIRAEGVDLRNLWLRNGYLIDGGGKAIRDWPYFVFSIEASQSRSDWGQMPGLLGPWSAFKDAAEAGDLARLKTAFEKVRLLVVASDDLLSDQRSAILHDLQRRFDSLKTELERPGIAPATRVVPTLGQLVAEAGGLAAADALTLIEPIDTPPPSAGG